MEYSTITIRNSISSADKPAAIVFSNGEDIQILDGLDGNALRGIARLLIRAAEHADEYCGDPEGTHGASSFSLGYELEWGEGTRSWPSEGFNSNGSEKLKK